MAPKDLQQFTFISGDAKREAAQEAIRVHVMRRQHRRRRQARAKSPYSKGHQADASFGIWMPIDSQSDSLGKRNEASKEQSEASPVGSTEYSHVSPGEVFASAPFQQAASLPVSAANGADDSPESVLVQYYLQNGGASKVTHELYRAYCETTATYSAFLAMIATSYANEKGRASPVDPTELENLAMREVSGQLSQSPTAPSTNTILAVALLANLREIRGERDLVQVHWDALRQMITISGGVNKFRVQQTLYTSFFWLECVVLSGVKTSIGQDEAESFETRGELVALIKHAVKPTQLSASYYRIAEPILDTLAAGPYKQEPYPIQKWRHAKLASLVFLAMIFGLHAVPMEKNSVFQAVAHEVSSRRRRYAMNAEELFYVLVLVCNQDDLTDLTAKVARTVNRTKSLDRRDMHTCYRILAAHIGFRDPHDADMISQDWDNLCGRLD